MNKSSLYSLSELRHLETEIASLVEKKGVGFFKRYRKGETIYEQGELGEAVFLLIKGLVKLYTISLEGKLFTHAILGKGHILGLPALLLNGQHQTSAEALETCEMYVIPIDKFYRLIADNPPVALIFMKEQARLIRSLNRRMLSLSENDLQQRLKTGLVHLADEHGYLSDKGVKIEVNLTHEEIASFLAANRSTITTYLNELKRRGYIWIEERRLVMVPPEHLRILDGLSRAVLDCDSKAAIRWAQKAVLEEVDPVKALEALVTAIRQIDEAYTRNKLSLPDVVGAAFAMKSAMPIIEEQLQRMKIKILTRGTIVIGTVFGDIHDIGKTMVAMLLTSEGFEVIDLGVNVAAEQFLSAVESFKPDILAMSSLMTMTIAQQKKVLNLLVEKGLREHVKVMVGGGAITEEIATQFDADGYDGTAQGAVKLAKRLIS